MRHHLKSLKQLSFTQHLLLFPIAGLLDLKDALKRDTMDGFALSWIFYLFVTTIWGLAVGIMVHVIYAIYTHRAALLIPGAIILGIVFLLVGIPRIIYKCANRKPRK